MAENPGSPANLIGLTLTFDRKKVRRYIMAADRFIRTRLPAWWSRRGSVDETSGGLCLAWIGI